VPFFRQFICYLSLLVDACAASRCKVGANVPFIVQSIAVDGQGCEATFNRQWPEWGVRHELVKTRSGWKFVNFHYSFYIEDGKTKVAPDTDLIQIQSQ
jgi:hypothetical protein